MPLILQENIHPDGKIGIWEIREGEEFFLAAGMQPGGYRHPQKRVQHFAGRYLLSRLSPLVSPDAILITEAGKPFQPDVSFDFSISHTGHLAAAIIAFHGRVGLDIQLPEPKMERVSGKFLSPKELKMLETLTMPSLDRLAVAWTAKEALIKWYGKGGLNLKADMVIREIDWSGTAGRVYCDFLRDGSALKHIVIRKIQDAYLSYLIDE
jgi:phosphopantetheinyl transferase